MKGDDISIVRFSDRKLGCNYKGEEFYILPNKPEITLKDLEKSFEALILKLDEEKEKEIETTIEDELGNRNKEALNW